MQDGQRAEKLAKCGIKCREGSQMLDTTSVLMPAPSVGQRFFYWLGVVAADARRKAGVSRATIAVLVNRDQSAVDRFERGTSRPHDIERMLAAYKEACELDDARDLAIEAAKRWRKHGSEPELY